LGIRKLAQIASAELGGQSIVVENRPGATGTIAIDAALRAKPDGYTLFTLSTSSVLIAPLLSKVPFDPVKDVSYIMNFAGPSQALLVRADSKYQTINDLIADARARPGEIAYATYGVSDTANFGIKALAKAKGVTFNHIPYKGSAQQLLAVLSGEVTFTSTSNYMTEIKNGRLRALALLDKQRYPGLPGIPTFTEIGVDFEFPWIMGLATSAKVPEPVRQKLETAFINATKNPEFIKFMAQQDVPIYIMNGQEMKADLAAKIPVYRQAAAEYGLIQN
ncbi:MAG TPA: tripartite tricarboxylate transporter substrate binding protein, partial [Eoetvoesiella sp.]